MIHSSPLLLRHEYITYFSFLRKTRTRRRRENRVVAALDVSLSACRRLRMSHRRDIGILLRNTCAHVYPPLIFNIYTPGSKIPMLGDIHSAVCARARDGYSPDFVCVPALRRKKSKACDLLFIRLGRRSFEYIPRSVVSGWTDVMRS